MYIIKIRFVILVTLTILSRSLYAEVSSMYLQELVARSDAIAVIEITKSEKLGEIFDKNLPFKGEFQYSQKNYFKFVKFIKHPFNIYKIKANNILWAGESFICFSLTYTKGKYLVFLKNIGENEWTTIICYLMDEKKDLTITTSTKLNKKSRIDKIENEVKGELFNNTPVSFYAIVSPSLNKSANFYRNNNYSQKIIFYRINSDFPISGRWPKGLNLFIPSFVPTNKIDSIDYFNILSQEKTYKISGKWKNGYIIITSMQDIESNENLFK